MGEQAATVADDAVDEEIAEDRQAVKPEQGEGEWEIDAALGAEIGNSLQKALQTQVEALLAKWKKRKILVLGFTGVGKTSLLEYMFDAKEPRQDKDQPTTRVNRYIFKVRETRFNVFDTPGHPTFADLLDLEINALVRGAYHGVINVVAFGYSVPRHGKRLSDEEQLLKTSVKKQLGDHTYGMCTDMTAFSWKTTKEIEVMASTRPKSRRFALVKRLPKGVNFA